MYTVGLHTLGCKVSQYETEAIAEGFLKRGFSVRPFDEKNDVYVINTCTVTAESDRKSRQMIRRATKKNPDAIVAVVGCYSQRSPSEVAAISGVDIVLGTDKKMSVVDIAIDMLDGGVRTQTVSTSDVTKSDFEPMRIDSAPRTRAYIKIEDGCESKCTYCAIADARGRVRSKPREDVIAEVEALYATGVREIVLTGIETGSYGKDFAEQYGLCDLIYELDARGSCERIRLGSLAPELIGKSFVDRVREVRILAPHFHLSLQSGSDSVLRRMKRRYNSAQALRNIELLREAFPSAQFTTDLMVGFPGETEEEFLDTCEIVRRAALLDAHVFAYSRRTGTEAADYPDQVPENIKRERSDRLIRIKNEVRESVLEKIVNEGKPLSAIVETLLDDGTYTAHTDTFVELNISCECERDLRGEMVYVTPVSHKNGVIYARICEN